jgi:DNA-directed RNA polymerase subunit F
MDEILKETNPNYQSFWQSGEFAFHNKLDITVTNETRKLAIEKAHFKLLERKKAQKKTTAVEPISLVNTDTTSEIKATEVLAYLKRLGISDQNACSTFLQVHLSDLAKCGLVNKKDLNVLGIFPVSLDVIDRTFLKIKNLSELTKETDLTSNECYSKIAPFITELSQFIGIIRFQRRELEKACKAWIMDTNPDRAAIIQGDLIKLVQLEQKLEALLADLHPESPRAVQELMQNGFAQKLQELQATVDDVDTLMQTLHLQVLDAYLKQYGSHAFWKKAKHYSPNMTLAALQGMEGFSSLPNLGEILANIESRK